MQNFRIGVTPMFEFGSIIKVKRSIFAHSRNKQKVTNSTDDGNKQQQKKLPIKCSQFNM